ncbi:MAG: amidohydrolase family protein [Clostridia bacterium]|mgnify:CR=1 FL=1|jgi:predicted TIM-barrel fold metal-dependent hydrolase|nr:amidohydrolase family protein [Clostridiaceae bacterium]
MLIDVHGHIGRVVPDRREFIDADNLIAKMDVWGIDITFVLPLSEHPEGAYMECDTDDVIAACSKYPDRLIPFCLIDHRFGNHKNMDFSYLLDEYTARGCIGFGEFLPKADFDDPLCINLYRQVGKYGLPIIFDMQDRPEGYGLRDDYGLPKLERALKLCPDTVFVGHGPTFWAEISAHVPENMRSGYPKGSIQPGGAVSRLMREYPNLWADLSAGSGYNALTRDPSFGIEFLDEFQDKLMFGTDSCLRSDVKKVYPNVDFIRRIEEEKKISKDAVEKIKWKNAVELFKLKITD